MPKERKPIFVKDKNDPRLLAYKDSLTLYNKTKPVTDWLDKVPRTKSGIVSDKDWINFTNSQKSGKEFMLAYNRLSKLNGKTPDNDGDTSNFRVGDEDQNYETGYTKFTKPVQPYIYRKEESINLPMKLLKAKNEDRDIIPTKNNNSLILNNNTSQIETTPYYNIKRTKDNTGKVINEEYYDFNNKPIPKMPYGGIYGDDVNQVASRNVTNKRLNPKEWDQQNINLGYQPTGFGNNSYKEYYNPNEYFKDQNGGFTKLADKGKIVDYTGDTTYKPTIKYIEPNMMGIRTNKPKPIIMDPMKQVGYNGIQQPISQNVGQQFAGGGMFNAQTIGAIGQGLNSVGGEQDTNMQYGSNEYFDKRNTSMGQSQNVANTVGTVIPIAGAFKAVGEGASNMIAKKDAYGVSDKSDAAVFAAGTLNPLESTTSAFNDIKSGHFNGKTAANLLLPGLGAIMNNNENKRHRNALQYQQAMDQRGNTSLDYAYGGVNDGQNAEVEKQENSISPSGEFTQYDGPSHENGGVPANLEPNEIVFSDRLKPKGINKTFAQLNKSYNTNKEDKMLEDKKSNSTLKTTAELMKVAKLKQSAALFQEQEALKQAKLANYAKRIGVNSDSFKMGGIKKYYSGGENDPYGPQQLPEGIIGAGYNPSAYNQAMQNVGVTRHWDNAQGPNIPNSSYQPTQVDQNQSNPAYTNVLKQLGIGLAQNAGNIYDLGRASNVQRETYNRVNPTLLDPTQSLKYNDMQGRMAADSIRNASQGNASTYLQNRKDLAINQMNTNDRIRQEYNNINAQIANQSKYYNAQTGDRETIANLQNQAQASIIRGNAISNMGANVVGQYRDSTIDKNMSTRDKEYLAIIAQRYPGILKDPILAKFYK